MLTVYPIAEFHIVSSQSIISGFQPSSGTHLIGLFSIFGQTKQKTATLVTAGRMIRGFASVNRPKSAYLYDNNTLTAPNY
jgi:hypothetical protein